METFAIHFAHGEFGAIIAEKSVQHNLKRATHCTDKDIHMISTCITNQGDHELHVFVAGSIQVTHHVMKFVGDHLEHNKASETFDNELHKYASGLSYEFESLLNIKREFEGSSLIFKAPFAYIENLSRYGLIQQLQN